MPFSLVVALSGWLKTARRKNFRRAGTLVLIAAIYFWRWENSRGEIDLTVLPLNGGHAVFAMDAAGRENDWLIDCGDANAVEFTLKPFLRAQGVNTIPRLILTEGDALNGGAELLDALFGVNELWTSDVKFRSSAYREAVAEFEKPPARHKILNYGETIGCWQILSPATTNNFARADDNALVLLGNFPGAKILLLSDLSRAGQRRPAFAHE